MMEKDRYVLFGFLLSKRYGSQVYELNRSTIVDHWTLELQEFNVDIQDPDSDKKNALKQLADLFVNQINCNVHFRFANGDSVGSHLNILSSTSSVFAAIFEKKMREESVDVEDIQSDIFKQLLLSTSTLVELKNHGVKSLPSHFTKRPTSTSPKA